MISRFGSSGVVSANCRTVVRFSTYIYTVLSIRFEVGGYLGTAPARE